MKVLIVNASDSYGGAARASYRLHCSLLHSGCDSTMFVQQKKRTEDWAIIGPKTPIDKICAAMNPYLDQLPLRFTNNDSNIYFSLGWFSFGALMRSIVSLQPDIVHLHWICKGTISISDLESLNIPVVWTLHDTWPFTGGCHTIGSCNRYLNGCGKCPALGSSRNYDLSSLIFNRKRRAYNKIKNMSIVGVSRWISQLAEASPLLGGRTVTTIPNAIDIKAYQPIVREFAKSILGIDPTKKIILFGAMSSLDDKNKGFGELVQALALLRHSFDDLLLVIFGSLEPKNKPTVACETIYLGYLQDDVSLRLAYSAADVVVVPSKQESFGQTASEAMACGTPVVAFATSGLLDIVDHRINGYLAAPNDIADLARGIEWILRHGEYEALSISARDKVVNEFSYEVVSRRHSLLYETILNCNQLHIDN